MYVLVNATITNLIFTLFVVTLFVWTGKRQMDSPAHIFVAIVAHASGPQHRQFALGLQRDKEQHTCPGDRWGHGRGFVCRGCVFVVSTDTLHVVHNMCVHLCTHETLDCVCARLCCPVDVSPTAAVVHCKWLCRVFLCAIRRRVSSLYATILHATLPDLCINSYHQHHGLQSSPARHRVHQRAATETQRVPHGLLRLLWAE